MNNEVDKEIFNIRSTWWPMRIQAPLGFLICFFPDKFQTQYTNLM